MNEARARRRYRRLLRFYPRAFRERWGAEMTEAFVVLLREYDARAGAWGRGRCWGGATLDAVLEGTTQRWRGERRRHDDNRGGEEMMGAFVADLRWTVRSLARRPLFTVTAVATLALGIGATGAVFTIVNGFMLRPLPYERPHELVALWAEQPELGWYRTDVGPADAADWAERSRTLADLAIFWESGFNLTGEGDPELLSAARVTPNLFGLLGRGPVIGRDFAADEAGEGRDGVLIVSDGFWERRFGRDPELLGSTLTLDGRAYQVVGILPEDFRFLDERIDVFAPVDVLPAETERGGHWANAIARLGDGASVEQAQAELSDIALQLEAEHPETNRGWGVSVASLHREMQGPIARNASVVMMTMVLAVLLMACVNVANLLLARAAGRSREVAIRAALGAGRGRVVRQLLTESLVLALAGGLLGMPLAWWGAEAIVRILPSEIPPVFQFEVDATVLAFIGLVTLATVLIFGLVPAFRTAEEGTASLRDGGRGGRTRRSGRFGGTLVVAQTAMAMVILVGGGLMVRSIDGMRTQDFGFDPDPVMTVRAAPPESSYPERADIRAFWDQVGERVAALPGVEALGLTQSHPLMGSNWGNSVWIVGRGTGEDERLSVRTTYATPGYADALGVELAVGRWLEESDGVEGAPMVAVVNEAFVRRYLGEGVDPLSQSLIRDVDEATEIPIVGVVRDLVERGVDDPVGPNWYLPIENTSVRARSLVLRTQGPPADILPAVRQAVAAVDPGLPLFAAEPLRALVDRRVGAFGAIADMMIVFGLMSLVLGAVGIYGVTAYDAARREGEIGVRMAMGAERGQLVRMVVGQGARRTALGLGLGLIAALGIGRLMSGLLFGVSPVDPVTFVTVLLVLGGVSLLGLWLPARRAVRADPVRALTAGE